MATKKENKKKKKVVGDEGRVYIFCNSNNTHITLTDKQGDVLAHSSAGALGNRGAKKSTPFAAQSAVEACLKDVAQFGISKVAIYVKGAGNAREAAIRSVGAAGLQVTMIKDVSPIAHNGCRPPKARRL